MFSSIYAIFLVLARGIKLMSALVAIGWSTSAIAATKRVQEPWLESFFQKTTVKLRQEKVPGYSMVFVQRNKPPLFFSNGVTEKQGKAVDEMTLFRLASVSKTFTGTLTSKLVEQGRLDWQTSISKLAPDVGFESTDKANITLGHVLSQSSGFVPNAYDNLIEANYSVPQILNKLAKLQPLCAPGQCYTYQNALFAVLDQYFAQNNASFDKLLREELLEPLQMASTSVGRAPLQSTDAWAKPHVLTRDKQWRKTSVANSYYRFAPAAGINTNTHDLGLWLKALLGERPDVVSPKIIADMTSPHVRTKREMRRRSWGRHLQDAYYGYGWRVYDFAGYKLNYHSGWVRGYRAEIAFAPDCGAGFAILMNAESNAINQIGADFWHGYFQRWAVEQADQQNSTAE